MEYLHNGVTEASQTIDNVVISAYRQFATQQEALRWLDREQADLLQTQWAKDNYDAMESWLKHLYATMRLRYLLSAEEKELSLQPRNYLRFSQGPEIDVIDLLTGKTPWTRLCAIGSGTYEIFIRRVQAMALRGITFDTSVEEYISRFCTAQARVDDLTTALPTENNLPAILSSARNALLSRTFTGKAVRLPARSVKSTPQRQSRKLLATLSAGAGLIALYGTLWWSWPILRTGQSKGPTNAMAQANAQLAALPNSAPPMPPSMPRPESPSASLNPASPEKEGYYVIGVAARDEATARQESEQRKQEGLSTHVVYSSNWSGLTPNYYLVVYDVMETRTAAQSRRKDLEKRGIKTYLMHSGKRVRP